MLGRLLIYPANGSGPQKQHVLGVEEFAMVLANPSEPDGVPSQPNADENQVSGNKAAAVPNPPGNDPAAEQSANPPEIPGDVIGVPSSPVTMMLDILEDLTFCYRDVSLDGTGSVVIVIPALLDTDSDVRTPALAWDSFGDGSTLQEAQLRLQCRTPLLVPGITNRVQVQFRSLGTIKHLTPNQVILSSDEGATMIKVDFEPASRVPAGSSKGLGVGDDDQDRSYPHFSVQVRSLQDADGCQRILQQCRAVIDSTCYDYASMQIVTQSEEDAATLVAGTDSVWSAVHGVASAAFSLASSGLQSPNASDSPSPQLPDEYIESHPWILPGLQTTITFTRLHFDIALQESGDLDLRKYIVTLPPSLSGNSPRVEAASVAAVHSPAIVSHFNDMSAVHVPLIGLVVMGVSRRAWDYEDKTEPMPYEEVIQAVSEGPFPVPRRCSCLDSIS